MGAVAGRFSFRPYTDPLKLGRRIALIVLFGCILGNLMVWTNSYFQSPEDRDVIAATSVKDIFYATFVFGGVLAVILVPVATLFLTPMILTWTQFFRRYLSHRAAFIVASLASASVFLVLALTIQAAWAGQLKKGFVTYLLDDYARLLLGFSGYALVLTGIVYLLARLLKK